MATATPVDPYVAVLAFSFTLFVCAYIAYLIENRKR